MPFSRLKKKGAGAQKDTHLERQAEIRYSEADEEKRETFKKTLAELEAKNPEKSTYYVDETGIDRYIYREKVRAKRGEKVYTKVRGKKFERLSIVAGKCGEHIVAPLVFSLIEYITGFFTVF